MSRSLVGSSSSRKLGAPASSRTSWSRRSSPPDRRPSGRECVGRGKRKRSRNCSADSDGLLVQADPLGPLLHVPEHRQGGVHGGGGLLEAGEHGVLPLHHRAGVGREPAGDELEEGRLAAAVRADHPHALPAPEAVGEGADDRPPAVALRDPVELEDLLPQAAVGGGELPHGRLPLRPGGGEVLEAGLAPLVLAGPGLRPPLEPLQLPAEDRDAPLLPALEGVLPLRLLRTGRRSSSPGSGRSASGRSRGWRCRRRPGRSGRG